MLVDFYCCLHHLVCVGNLGVTKVSCDAAQYGPAVPQLQATLFKSQADAGSDCAKGLEGQGLGITHADQGGHHLLQLHFGGLS